MTTGRTWNARLNRCVPVSLQHSPPSRRVMARLCFHFSRKVQARHDEVQGEVLFPWGRCEFEVVEGGLAVLLSVDDAASLQRVREVVDAHVALFSRKQPTIINWLSPA
ncbi:DUF2218 domain-containing protein [Sphaerotilus sp.]|uniref:DUF2218 domain-containing protein n=1 Tax=Sphaerotilus sp. TaxID=2093942 RepID=UPI002ACDDE06|nr:DUF2218 domain-containing protein [Sphaerotilus sp.]MDZ7855884.1 DUF2218 domain-containing protein [Sphaerotilus sp.]